MCTILFLFPSPRGSIEKVKTNTSENRFECRVRKVPSIIDKKQNEKAAGGWRALHAREAPGIPWARTRRGWQTNLLGFASPSRCEAPKKQTSENPQELIPKMGTTNFFPVRRFKITARLVVERSVSPNLVEMMDSAEPLLRVPVAVVLAKTVGVFVASRNLAERWTLPLHIARGSWRVFEKVCTLCQ